MPSWCDELAIGREAEPRDVAVDGDEEDEDATAAPSRANDPSAAT